MIHTEQMTATSFAGNILWIPQG